MPELTDVRLVISDGGSTDETIKIALESGAVIARGIAGRGAQMARGAELAGASDQISAFLFLHADCMLLPLRILVWLRVSLWCLPYGDQGLLIPREMYESLGGFDREKSLFEDVDIVDRIKSKFGRKSLRKLPMGLQTDVSDHARQGGWKRGWNNFWLLKAYRRGVPIDELVRKYN